MWQYSLQISSKSKMVMREPFSELGDLTRNDPCIFQVKRCIFQLERCIIPIWWPPDISGGRELEHEMYISSKMMNISTGEMYYSYLAAAAAT